VGKDAGMKLVRPTAEHLAGYVEALDRGWSPDPDDPDIVGRERRRIADAPDDFLALMDDREARGGPIPLPDGSTVPRLPGLRRWLWDGAFCGYLSLRWQPGTLELPPHCLGHIGYAVVPWKRRRGYATEALRQALPLALAEGLPAVTVTTDPDNVASQRVIENNGGVLVGSFELPESHGGGRGLEYRIDLR
jgi:predicted acetyltransferase